MQVVMRFELCMGWRISFRDPRNERTLFREYTFADPEKIEQTGCKVVNSNELGDKTDALARLAEWQWHD